MGAGKRKTASRPHEGEPEGFRIRGLDMPLNAALLLAIVCILLYMCSLQGPFVFDDIHTIVENPYITNIKNIPGFFLRSKETATQLEHAGWRPLWYTSFALNYHFGGLNSAGYHAVNIALHWLNCILVYFLAFFLAKGRAGRPWLAALLAGLLFAVHPLQTESVSYIVGRSALMVTFFYLVSFYLYVRFRENGWLTLFALSALSFCMALFSKETAVTLPLMVIVYDFSVKGREGRPFAGFAVLAAAAAAFTVFRFYIASLVPGPAMSRGFLEHWLTEAYIVPVYMAKVLLPAGLNLDPDVREITSLADPRLIVSVLVLAAAAYGLYRLYRYDRLMGFFGSWFFVALITETVFPITDYMAEHRTYLPMAGVALLFGYLMEKAVTARKLVWGVIAACVILALGFMTFERDRVYATEVGLWKDTVSKSPDKARPVMALGVALHKEGKLEEAHYWLERAVKLDPASSYSQYNLGRVLMDMKRYKEALVHEKHALELLPDDYYFLTGIGVLYHQMGDEANALRSFKRAIESTPDYPVAHLNLAAFYLSQDKPEDAVGELKEALRLEPHNPTTHENLGAAYLGLGKYDLSLKESMESLKFYSGNPGPHFNMAKAYLKLGDKARAAEEFRTFLRMAKPDHPSRKTAEEDLKKLQ